MKTIFLIIIGIVAVLGFFVVGFDWHDKIHNSTIWQEAYGSENYTPPEPPFCDEIYSDETLSEGICVKRKVWEVQIIGGGPIDHDPNLSPTFALDLDFPSALFYHTILPLAGLGLGISALFLVPHFILKRKNIPSKPYLSLILAGVLLYIFIPHVIGTLHTFTMIFSQPHQIITWVFDFRFIFVLIPIIVCVISGITIYKSTVIRKLIKK